MVNRTIPYYCILFLSRQTLLVLERVQNSNSALDYWNKNKMSDKKQIALSIFAVAGATFLLSSLIYYLRSSSQETGTRRGAEESDPKWEPVDDDFEKIAKVAATLENLGDGERLVLYALYKQTTLGDAPANFKAKSWNILVEKAKFDSWARLRGMSSVEARRKYFFMVESLSERRFPGDETEDDYMGKGVMSQPVQDDEDPSNFDSSPSSCFLLAALQNDTETLEKLKDSVEVNYHDPSGLTALHLAADRGNDKAVRTLISLGADIDSQDDDGVSVLQAATMADQFETCQILLEAGANPDLQDSDGDCARSCAADASQRWRDLFSNYQRR